MRRDDDWEPHGSGYKQMDVTKHGDERLQSALEWHVHMADHASDRVMPQYRQWRRLLVREALKRGLIDADPGGAP